MSGELLDDIDLSEENVKRILERTDQKKVENITEEAMELYRNRIKTKCNCSTYSGCSFKTAEELMNARIYHGKSIKELWDKINIIQVEGITTYDWLKSFAHVKLQISNVTKLQNTFKPSGIIKP